MKPKDLIIKIVKEIVILIELVACIATLIYALVKGSVMAMLFSIWLLINLLPNGMVGVVENRIKELKEEGKLCHDKTK